MAQSTLRRDGFLIGSIIGIAILLWIGWSLVYEYAVKALQREGSLRLQQIASFNLASAIWWRNFLALAFDVLIIVVAFFGTWWVLAALAAEASEAGRWRGFKSSKWVLRWTGWQRVQHIWILLTFFVCAVTGLAANLHVLASRQALMTWHLYSGLTMGVLVVIHFVQYTVEALIAKSRGESLREKYPMLEIYSWRFLKNLGRGLKRLFNPKVRVEAGKYDPEQLFEYWGVYWGIAILGIPGLIMWLYGPNAVGGVLWVMHTKEAILATAFIVMVHLAYSHFRPSTFPIDMSFLTGKIPLERAEDEHPEWAKKLKAEEVVERKEEVEVVIKG